MKKSATRVIVTALILFCKNASSQDLVWAKQFAGNINSLGKAIAADGNGNVYTTGNFSGTFDFDPGPGTYNLTSAGMDDMFISKLDASGNFVWAKRIGGTDYDQSFSIAIGSNGDVYTTGYFYNSVDFNPGNETQMLTADGVARDIFISKLNSNGDFIWVKQIGGTDYEVATAITLDALENVIVTGAFAGTVDFDPNGGDFAMTSTVGSNNDDIFILKLTSDGNFQWAKRMGGLDGDSGLSIKTDASGNILTTGYFKAGVDFDPGDLNYYISIVDASDIFVSKLDPSGNFMWAKAIAGTGEEQGNSIDVDASENVYITGGFHRTVDFDPGIDEYNIEADSLMDIFVTKLNVAGELVWAKQFGGLDDAQGNSIAVDEAGNVYSTGIFTDTVDFDPSDETYNLTSISYGDVYISKLDASGNFVWANQIGGGPYNTGFGIDAANGSVYITGNFNGTCDFDPGSGIFNMSGLDLHTNAFIVRLNAVTGVIENKSSSHDLTIFPNPASQSIVIGMHHPGNHPCELKIFDETGKLVYQSQIIGSKTSVDVSKFENGVYYVEVSDEAKISTQKLIVQH